MSVQPILETTASEAFAEEMLGYLNGAAITMMTTLGHRMRLFDTMSILPPCRSEHLARAAGLEERYVREWLAAMVTAGIVRYDPQSRTYELPPEHAASLTRGAGSDNLAAMAQLLTTFAQVEDALVEVFRIGGGVPYGDYPRIDEVMFELTSPKLEKILDPLLHLSPSLLERLNDGIDVLDVGCGQGRALILLAQRFPRSRFTGIDVSEPAIEAGRREVAALGLENVRFEVRDAAELDAKMRYGLIVTFDAIHDQAEPLEVLQNIHAALRPGGTYVMVEPDASTHLQDNIGHPMATLLYVISTFHCMTVSLAGKGAGLGAVWGRERALAMVHTAGFSRVRVERLADDPINAYFVMSRA